MNSLQLRHLLDEAGPTIRPYIDGADLLAAGPAPVGLDPDEVLPPHSDRLLPTRAGRLVLLGLCTCGFAGCGRLEVHVRRVRDTVVWEPSQDGPTIGRGYRFALVDYLDAVDRAADDRPGEGRGGHIARLVRTGLDRAAAFDDVPRGRVDRVAAESWESAVVRVGVTPGGSGRIQRTFAPGLDESDADVAARVLAEIPRLLTDG